MDNMTKILLLAGVILLFAYLYISQNNDENNDEDNDIFNDNQYKRNYADIKCPNQRKEKFTQDDTLININPFKQQPIHAVQDGPLPLPQDYIQEQKQQITQKPQQIIDETDVVSNDTNSIDESQLLSQIHSKEIDMKNKIIEENTYSNKFKSINQANPDEYKQINYSGGNRNGKPGSDWQDQFLSSNELLGISSQFSPLDETNNMYASFSQKKNIGENINLNGNARGKNAKDENPEDIYDVDKLLPKEIKKDWFEVTPEPIRVKDRHLINTTRPVGINTIGTTLKNPSLDIRGAPSCPKYVVSPWMQSSIEPDTNIKPFCGM